MPTLEELQKMGAKPVGDRTYTLDELKKMGATPQYRSQAPPAPGPDESGFTLTGLRDLAWEVGKPGILPGIGEAVGTVAGTALTGGNPLGGKILGSAGAVVGELGNNALGVTEFSPAQLALTAAAPPLSRVLLGGAQAANVTMPGRRATAETLNTNAFDAAKSMVGQYRPQGPSAKDLFALARQQQVQIPVPKALASINEALVSIAKNPETRDLSKGLETHLRTLRTELAGYGGQISPDIIQDKIASITTRVNALSGDNVKPLSALANKVKAGILDDLDTAAASGLPNSGPAQNLIHARATYLREQSVQELEDAIKGAAKLKRGQTTEQFDANKAIDTLKESPFHERAFSKAEQKEIYDTLHLLNQVPVLPAPRGAATGSGRTLGVRGLGGGLTTTTATALGADPLTAGALGLAVAGAPYVVDWKHNIAMMLATPQGRQVLTNMIKGGGTEKKYQAAGAAAAGLTGIVGKALQGYGE